jgi:heme exporter protein B
VKQLWTGVSTLLWKDILAEIRARELVLSILVFVVLVLVVFNFAFRPGPDVVTTVGPGVLWVAFTFAGVLGMNRTFVLEKDRGCMEGLMLCPVGRESIYLGKMLSIFLFMLVVELATIPIFSAIFNLPLFPPRLILVMALGTLGFAALGTVFSALAVNTRSREVLLPVLFFPMVVPVLISAVQASAVVFRAEPWSELLTWIEILLAFDVVFLVVSPWIFEHVLEE